MTKEEIGNLIGSFTWNFGDEFLIETNKGNFTWSDPEYNGNGILKKFTGNYESWCKKNHIPFGRDKGKHKISDYCGNFSFLCRGKVK